MLSLSIVAACIIGCNAVNCPSGTSQVGGAQTSGSQQCGGYSDITDIATCKTFCESSACGGNCQAFGYSDRYDRCALYQSATIGSYNVLQDQILCAITAGGSVTCPDGTEQVQGARSGTRRCLRYSGVTDIGICKTRCESACNGKSCQAFGYSAKYDQCDTFQSATPGSYGAHADQIVCAVTAGGTTSPTTAPTVPPPQCPKGSTQVGGIPQSGLNPLYLRGSPSATKNSIEDCRDYCYFDATNIYKCVQFSYSDATNKCVTYRDARRGPPGSGKIFGPDQILCRRGIDLECPTGTIQFGGFGAHFRGAPLVYQPPQGHTLEQCRDGCDSYSTCTAFGFDYVVPPGPTWGLYPTVCRGYNANSGHTVGTYPHSVQILCAVTSDFSAQSPIWADLECPAGTSQIGGIGAYFQNAPQVTSALYCWNIEECRDNCDRHGTCTAFAFDYDSSHEDVSPTVCRGYNANSGHAVGTYSGGPQMDQILCAVTSDFSAQSPGLFSVDGMVGYSNGNGQVYVQIPAYVVYGIVALILVNIVCLMVHCWNKSRGNSKEYKTVSMRSDIDEETDIN